MVMSASAIPPARAAGSPTPWIEMTLKVLIMPDTVPSNPSNGVRLAMVAKMPTRFSRMTASRPPRSSTASLTNHMPLPMFFNPAEKMLEIDDVSPWQRKRASDTFCCLSNSPTLRINSSGRMCFRLNTHNRSRNTASAMMEQKIMGYINTPPFIMRSITVPSPNAHV